MSVLIIIMTIIIIIDNNNNIFVLRDYILPRVKIIITIKLKLNDEHNENSISPITY